VQVAVLEFRKLGTVAERFTNADCLQVWTACINAGVGSSEFFIGSLVYIS
jgi:hypothetical protein